MVDVLGWRKVFAVIGPSTNTVVQPDMEAMRPSGVTNAYRDIYVENPQALSDASFMAGAQLISNGVKDSLRTAMTCAPDYLVLGVSVISFLGGQKGCDALIKQVEDFTGIGVSVGSNALVAAMKAYGGIKRVAFLSPYYPAANASVRQFLTEHGFEVKRDIPLLASSWTNIATIDEARLRQTLIELDGDDIDAICQIGTNLSMVRLAAEAEVWLGKPVIAAVNTWTSCTSSGSAPSSSMPSLMFSVECAANSKPTGR